MLDTAKRLLDALAAQRRAALHGDGRDGGGGPDRGRAAGTSSIWRSGQPAAPAPRTAIAAARAALDGPHRATPRRSASRRCGRASRGTMRETYNVDVDPGADRRHDRLVGRRSSSPFWRCSSPATGSALANPGYPPYRHILTALGCEPVLIETDADDPLGDDAGSAARGASQEAAARACWSRARPIRPAP